MLPTGRVVMTTQSRPTAMVPSHGGISLALSASDIPMESNYRPSTTEFDVINTFEATSHPEDCNLNNIPPSLLASFKQLPIWLKISLGACSVAAAMQPMKKEKFLWMASQRIPHLTVWLLNWAAHHCRSVVSGIFHWPPFIRLVIKSCFLYVLMSTAMQELLPRFRPSRISASELLDRYHLPSNLSKYEAPNKLSSKRMHWIELEANQEHDSFSKSFDVVYVNHGFGASSLSWLPLLPSIASRLARKTVLGHDAPGFGFTDRPQDDLQYFSLENSGVIGSSLLRATLDRTVDAISGSTVLLMGHSMGSLTTLHMAAQLDPSIQLRIILIAPALGLRATRPVQRGGVASLQGSRFPVRQALGRSFDNVVTPFASYFLRRLVGRSGFWRDGLKLAWGDASRLRNSDILRYQWPSIGKGWERGLLQFVRAQGSQASKYTSDEELLRTVLELPNVRSVDVIVSSGDKVVPAKRIRSFLKNFPSVIITEIDGLGHNPFEEDCGVFMETLVSILESRSTRKE